MSISCFMIVFCIDFFFRKFDNFLVWDRPEMLVEDDVVLTRTLDRTAVLPNVNFTHSLTYNNRFVRFF